MRVVLAGYNIDHEVIEEARQLGVDPGWLTPETLSAAYARISRNPAPVDELRRQARYDLSRARASNEQIVFEMGHASISEHAVFNFDLMGLSRLAIEAVEHFRLCSFTEKSQRYIRLEDDYVVPQEIVEWGLADQFHELVAWQNRTYHLLYEKLREHIFARSHDRVTQKSQRKTLEGWAKEDARYVSPLAMGGQLGLTLNARNLELMIRRLSQHPLQEVRRLASALEDLACKVAPSLIRYTTTSDTEKDPSVDLAQLATSHLGQETEQTLPGNTGAVQLVSYTKDGDTLVVAGLLHGVGSAPWTTCYERALAMSTDKKAQVIRAALRPLGAHDAPPRAFELVSFCFDLVLSASCFAQLKRHRMASLIVQPYDPILGYTMPETVAQVGLAEEFQNVMAESNRFFKEVASHHPLVASYGLTQAHRRRVLLQMNGRELYHFSRLRQDHHAQWDIRQLADRMLYLARQEMPLTLMLACGKDRFVEQRIELFPEG